MQTFHTWVISRNELPQKIPNWVPGLKHPGDSQDIGMSEKPNLSADLASSRVLKSNFHWFLRNSLDNFSVFVIYAPRRKTREAALNDESNTLIPRSVSLSSPEII